MLILLQKMSANINCKVKFLSFLRVRNILYNKHLVSINRNCNTGILKGEKLEDYFFDQKVQSILKKITGLDFDIVFRPKKQRIVPHKYEFVTDKQLEKMMDEATKKAQDLLHMPPVMDERKPIEEVLSKDPELQGYLESKLVFTDTSLSKNSRNRIITVRESDGTLRKANWEERFRMNQIFFPIPRRSLETPKLFESPYLDKLLDEEKFLFVLDSACCQFEPDDPEYHRVTRTTYEQIKSKKKFDVLRSTRHFGPMAFYFAVTNNIEALLTDMIEKELISDAADTIKMLYMIHPELEEATQKNEIDNLDFVQEFVQRRSKSPETANLELALQSYIEASQSSVKENASV